MQIFSNFNLTLNWPFSVIYCKIYTYSHALGLFLDDMSTRFMSFYSNERSTDSGTWSVFQTLFWQLASIIWKTQKWYSFFKLWHSFAQISKVASSIYLLYLLFQPDQLTGGVRRPCRDEGMPWPAPHPLHAPWGRCREWRGRASLPAPAHLEDRGPGANEGGDGPCDRSGPFRGQLIVLPGAGIQVYGLKGHFC